MKKAFLIIMVSFIGFICKANTNIDSIENNKESVMFIYKKQQNEINSINLRMDMAGRHFKHGSQLIIGGTFMTIFGGVLAGLMSTKRNDYTFPLIAGAGIGVGGIITSVVGISHIAKGGKALSRKENKKLLD